MTCSQPISASDFQAVYLWVVAMETSRLLMTNIDRVKFIFL